MNYSSEIASRGLHKTPPAHGPLCGRNSEHVVPIETLAAPSWVAAGVVVGKRRFHFAEEHASLLVLSFLSPTGF